MGLDATVYKQVDELQIPASEMRYVSIDARTGQWDFANRNVYEKWNDKVKAVSKRLGNITLIDSLRDEVERTLPFNSALVKKVLFSGTHAGDILTEDDIAVLKSEIMICRDRLR